jgi:hypothetical protein
LHATIHLVFDFSDRDTQNPGHGEKRLTPGTCRFFAEGLEVFPYDGGHERFAETVDASL